MPKFTFSSIYANDMRKLHLGSELVLFEDDLKIFKRSVNSDVLQFNANKIDLWSSNDVLGLKMQQIFDASRRVNAYNLIYSYLPRTRACSLRIKKSVNFREVAVICDVELENKRTMQSLLKNNKDRKRKYL
uniref:Uncharacterized protein n=1 Tax=Romanomermis culicivorax TaxID=13658 RepID=A0A915JRP7_ROMCU